MNYLARFVRSQLVFPGYMPAAHLPHQRLSNNAYLFLIQNSSGVNNAKRYSFLQMQKDFFSLSHTLLPLCETNRN